MEPVLSLLYLVVRALSGWWHIVDGRTLTGSGLVRFEHEETMLNLIPLFIVTTLWWKHGTEVRGRSDPDLDQFISLNKQFCPKASHFEGRDGCWKDVHAYRQSAAVAGMRAQKRCRVESVLPDGWRRFSVTSHTELLGCKGCDAVRLRVYTHKHGYHPPLPRFHDFYSVYTSP